MTKCENRATIENEYGIDALSTHEEIMAVYEEDIYRKSKVVESKFGKAPFYDNFNGFSFDDLYSHSGIEKIRCSEFTPKIKKWSKKYAKSLGEKA